MSNLKRIGWNDYFMEMCYLVSKRSTCQRGQVGAVIVRDNSILATGYNGSPKGFPHCEGSDCIIYKSFHPDGTVEENCVRTIHAEVNAIAQAARNGTSINGACIYISSSPCMNCLKILINVGIQTIYYRTPYKIEHISELIKLADIQMIKVD